MLLRLDRILSDAGTASRSEARLLVQRGLVTVDGAVPASAREKFDPTAAEILVRGVPVRWQVRHVLLMNKPAGVVTSTEDPRDRTVMDLLPEPWRDLDLFPVGRLDKDTEGLLLLTDDGRLAHRLTAPRHEVPKRYYARVEGVLTGEDREAFHRGIVLRDGTRCRPAELELLEGGTAALVTVTEGKYHQVKRMLAAVGKPVTYLERRALGPLELDDALGRGEVRELSGEEIDALEAAL